MINVIPQLAESIKVERLPSYCTNDRYWLQQKADGHRKCIIVEDGKVRVVGRNGQETDLACKNAFAGFPGTWVFDGEVLPDGVLWLFDLPVAGDKIGLQTPYRLRQNVLDGLKEVLESEQVRILPTARTTEEKVSLAKKVITSGAEGVMIKDTTAGYASGRRSNAILKGKLVKDIDCFITRFGIGKSSDGSGNPKANCELAVLTEPMTFTEPMTYEYAKRLEHEGKLKFIAECIIHPKERNQVDVGSVVTAAYLYAVDPKKPRLVQPTRIRVRPNDKSAEECLLSQMVFTDKSVIEP